MLRCCYELDRRVSMIVCDCNRDLGQQYQISSDLENFIDWIALNNLKRNSLRLNITNWCSFLPPGIPKTFTCNVNNITSVGRRVSFNSSSFENNI